MTWCLLATTVLGNAGQLGMHAEHITPPWWVAVLVGAIAPAVVGSSVHLLVLLGRRPAPALRPVQVGDQQLPAIPEDQKGSGLKQTPADAGAVTRRHEASDDELVPAVRNWIAAQSGTPSQRQLRSAFGVGAERARKLMEAAA